MVHFNMARTHQAIGKTSAEAAGLDPLVGFQGLGVLKAASAGQRRTGSLHDLPPITGHDCDRPAGFGRRRAAPARKP